MIELLDLDNYALTNHVSRYNEDGLTGKYLLMSAGKKLKESIYAIDTIKDAIDTSKLDSYIEYSADETLYLGKQVRTSINIKKSSNRYYPTLLEDGKSPIELAGNINRIINEGIEYIESYLSELTDVPGAENLKEILPSYYVDMYNDCAMTLLELAGVTANNVNNFVDIVNNLYSVLQGDFNLDPNAEILTLAITIDENETGIL